MNRIISRLVAEDDSDGGEKADKEPRATGSLAIRQLLSFRGQRCVHVSYDHVRTHARTHVRTQCRVARTCVHAVQAYSALVSPRSPSLDRSLFIRSAFPRD